MPSSLIGREIWRWMSNLALVHLQALICSHYCHSTRLPGLDAKCTSKCYFLQFVLFPAPFSVFSPFVNMCCFCDMKNNNKVFRFVFENQPRTGCTIFTDLLLVWSQWPERLSNQGTEKVWILSSLLSSLPGTHLGLMHIYCFLFFKK